MAKVLLGITGGIAAYKSASLIRLFRESGHEVQIITTKNAERFIGAATLEALSGRPVAAEIWDDVAEVKHIALAQWAEVVVVAPATAAFLARYAAGLADDLLLNVLLATKAPVVLAPAMHSEMWLHEATTTNTGTLIERGVSIIPPATGRLTGADTGIGRLPEAAVIFEAVLAQLGPKDLSGRSLLITAGGTREPLDAVRFFGNRSSGKQGFALAARAHARGASVTLIAANVALPTPPGVERVNVETASELGLAVSARLAECDALIMAAAVADYRPIEYHERKIKRSQENLKIELEPNPDIVADASRQKPAGCRIVAFAAETAEGDELIALAAAKLERKGADLIVANSVTGGATFESDSSAAYIIGAELPPEHIVGTKERVADAVLDALRANWA